MIGQNSKLCLLVLFLAISLIAVYPMNIFAWDSYEHSDNYWEVQCSTAIRKAEEAAVNLASAAESLSDAADSLSSCASNEDYQDDCSDEFFEVESAKSTVESAQSNYERAVEEAQEPCTESGFF